MLKNAYRRTKAELKNPKNRRIVMIVVGGTVFQAALVAYARHDLKTQ